LALAPDRLGYRLGAREEVEQGSVFVGVLVPQTSARALRLADEDR
jgi:hypothetical protein